MTQCCYTAQDPRGDGRWNCTKQKHPVGDDDQLGHEPPPNIGYAVPGPWEKPASRFRAIDEVLGLPS